MRSLKSTKIHHRRKKSPAKFRQKIKTTFLGHEYFLLLKLKLRYFVQESAAKLTIIYLLEKTFFKNFVFLNDTVADLAVRYILCERYTLYAYCISRGLGKTDPCGKPVVENLVTLSL